jgi:hypothetical protein
VAEHTHHIDRCATSMYNGEDAHRRRDPSHHDLSAVGFIEPGEWVCADDGRRPVVIGDISPIKMATTTDTR